MYLRLFPALFALLLIACGGTPAAAPVAERPEASAAVAAEVDRVALVVSDLDREAAFFTGVLGFEREGDFESGGPELATLLGLDAPGARGVRLRLGTERIALVTYGSGRSFPDGSRSNDRWFQHLAIVVSDIDRAWAAVEAAGVPAISAGGPQTIPLSNPAAGGIRAVYFRDPEGHPLELIWYPAGKGQPRWQESGGRLFLGIDHTAIASGDTDASIRFYGDVLGLSVRGESLNEGAEQEALSGVDGARVRITGLGGSGGPGVELLEYLAPRDGRAAPADTRPDDGWSTEITAVGDVDRAYDRAPAAGGTVVSSAVVTIDGRREVLLRDPDGHAVRVVSR